jgi:RNA polymerase sigma-70 factor (ECF subfamily)
MDEPVKSDERPAGEVRPTRDGHASRDDHDDGLLVERAKHGDPAAYEALMRRHNQRLYRVVRSVLRTGSEVEDTMQDTYLAALRNLDQFEGRAAFGTWLLKIGTNVALARMRQRMRVVALDDLPDLDGEMIELDTVAPTPEQHASNYEMVGIVEQAIDRLPYDYRQVFVLRTIEALDTFETAEVLGLNEEAVRQRLHRARAMLQADIQRRVGEAMEAAFGFLGHRCDRVVTNVLRRMSEPATNIWN